MKPLLPVLFVCLPITKALAQNGPLLTFSQDVYTQSLGGGPLQVIHPNEIGYLPWPLGCSNGNQCEKWSPRTCMQVMAGDENGDGQYWNPNLFGSIDALALPFTNFGPGKADPRSVFWSPSAAMGSNITPSPLRPGDIGRIVKGASGDGQVELLMSQEQVNISLGLPPGNPIDLDGFAFEPGLGVYFTVSNHLFLASPGCSPNSLVADGDLLAIRDADIVWSLDYRVLSVAPNSAYIVKTEADFSAMLVNAQISDRNGQPITAAIDLKDIDIYHGPGAQITMVNPCGNVLVPVPEFWFATESMTGGSLMTTLNGGQVGYSNCGYAGLPLPYVQTGIAVGIQGSPSQGPDCYVTGLAMATTQRFVLEPDTHQQNYNLLGGPATTVHVSGDFPWVFNWVQWVPTTVPISYYVPPFSAHCFPDIYFSDFIFWGYTPMTNGFGSFASAPIPLGWSGKLLFQCIALNGPDIEISTPTVIDVN